MKKRLPSLRSVLAYKNPEVVARFCKELGVPRSVGQVIFKDLLRYLYLSDKARRYRMSLSLGKKPRGRPTFIYDLTKEVLIIDEIWHSFLMYTTEYADFSQKYFGYVIPHIPEPAIPKKISPAKQKKIAQRLDAEFEAYLESIYDEFGPAVLKRWFEIYPRKFSPSKIRKLKMRVN